MSKKQEYIGGEPITGYDPEDGCPLVEYRPGEYFYDPKTGVFCSRELSKNLQRHLGIDIDRKESHGHTGASTSRRNP